jgi:hypothetical protein
MKLVKCQDGIWQYRLDQTEFNLLITVLKKFPFTDLQPVKISRTDKDPKAKEREKLLNESLAQHRKELKKAAGNILDDGKIKHQKEVWMLTLSPEDREMLLQILNDVRVGCWNALGQPQELEPDTPDLTAREIANYGLLNLAGYFECGLLKTES